MFLNEEFIRIYEELSLLNEHVRQALLKDVIGAKDGQPIFKNNSTINSVSLLDFIDKDATKKLNPKLPENSDAWGIHQNYHYVINCPDPGCRGGKQHTLKGEGIWKRIEKNPVTSKSSTARELALCRKCINKLNSASNMKWTMNTFGGFVEGKPVKATTTCLHDFLDVELSLKDLPQLIGTDSTQWSALDTGISYWYNCPRCGTKIKRSAQAFNHTIASATKNGEQMVSVEDLVCCNSCAKATLPTVADEPAIWDRIPDWLFLDKAKRSDAILSDKGFKVLYELNNDRKYVPKTFIKAIQNKTDSFRLGKYLTVNSKVALPFVCSDCGKEYSAVIDNAYKAKSLSVCCPVCIAAAERYRKSSACEWFLKETILSLFKTTEKQTPKAERFGVIDVLFEYNGQLIGIEYDGGRWHRGDAIARDEAKTKLYSAAPYNIKFIRVREPGCDAFDDTLAKTISIRVSFTRLTYTEYLDCINKICAEIGYTITDQDKILLKDVFTTKSSVKKYLDGQRTTLPTKKTVVKENAPHISNTAYIKHN